MTREELLELAPIDALGLLDEYESALYTRSFHHAPAAVQEEIKDVQAAFASEPRVLPDVEPDAQLRRRVLGGVSAAVERETAELAPLAMIGRSAATRRGSQGRAPIGVSGLLWRAATFMLAAGLLASLYFLWNSQRENAKLTDVAIGIDTDQTIEEVLGGDFQKDFLKGDTKTYVLKATSNPDSDLHAVLFYREDGEAFLYTVGLPDHREYKLAAVERDGEETLFARTFEPIQLIHGVRLGKLSPETVAGATWQISNAVGTVLLERA